MSTTSAPVVTVTQASSSRSSKPIPPTRWELTKWLFSQAGSLVLPLVLAVIFRILNQLMTIALLVLSVYSVILGVFFGTQYLPRMLWLMVGVALGKAFLRYLEQYCGHWVAFSSLQRLRANFFKSLVPQSPAAVQGKAGSELSDRAVGDIDRIEVFFAHTFPPCISAIVVPIIAIGWLASVAPLPLALALIPGTFFLVVIQPIISMNLSWSDAKSVANQRGVIAEHLGDDIQGIREVLAFDLASQRLASLAAVDRDFIAIRSRAAMKQGLRNALQLICQLGNLIAVIVVGGLYSLNPLEVMMAAILAAALWVPVSGIDDFAAGLDGAFAATNRIYEIMMTKPEVVSPDNPVAMPIPAVISAQHLGFGYRKDAPVLRDVSVTFPVGKWTYIVGVSGSGKSTLGALILRGWDIDSGRLEISGVPVSDIALSELRSRIGLVAQRDTMLSGTLAENLRLRRPEASDDELMEALRLAALEDWVASLPEGLATPIAERGLSLSGGQLQRLALARTLVGQPEVLLIDEALSQLDAVTALMVRDRLAKLGKTVIEITHRVDVIPADAEVLVLDAGMVVQHGTAAELRSDAAGAFNKIAARE